MICIDKQMPTNCYDCWIRQNMGCRIANDSGWLNDRRDDKCPLKTQDPMDSIVVPNGIDRSGGWWFQCPSCKMEIEPRDRYCRSCGQAVKWE